MASTKKKVIITVVIIFLVLFLVIGVLKGWFRNPSKLSEDELIKLQNVQKGNISSTAISQNNFRQIWNDHIALTREVILAEFNNDPSLKSKVDSLLRNQEEMGNEVNKYYPGSKEIVTELFTEHINQAKDILDDLKYKRLGRIAQDISRWYDNADRISLALNKINPNWQLKQHMRTHLNDLENQVLTAFVGLQKASKNIYDKKTIANTNLMANHMIEGLR